MNIHEKITKYREQSGLNKSQLAREIGVSPAYITMLENGSKSPSKELIVRMAYVFNTNPKELDPNIQLNEYNELNETFKELFNSPKSENEKELLNALRDVFFKSFKERGTYRTSLFLFYEALGELKNSPVYYDNIDKKIIDVGLDNFKKALPIDDLSILKELIYFVENFKIYLNGYNEHDKEVLSMAEKKFNRDINKFTFLNIPKDKELKLELKLVDKKHN